MSDPKRCPFCDSDEVTLVGSPTDVEDAYVTCDTCKARGPEERTGMAIGWWNSRYEDR